MTPTLEFLYVPSQASLDPVAVFWRNWERGKGEVTITCFGEAWTSYFGSMAGMSIQQFFSTASTEYLVHKLTNVRWMKKTSKPQHDKYLTKVVTAIKEQLA